MAERESAIRSARDAKGGGLRGLRTAEGRAAPWAMKLRGKGRTERRDTAVVCKALAERSRLGRKHLRTTEACMRGAEKEKLAIDLSKTRRGGRGCRDREGSDNSRQDYGSFQRRTLDCVRNAPEQDGRPAQRICGSQKT